jgi:single-stranded-DNA-specific exonuclease
MESEDISKFHRRGEKAARIRRWIVKEADPEQVHSLSRGLDIPEAVARVLVNRGVGDVEAAKRFLSPTLRELHPPEMLTDMDRATERICSAVKSGEEIIIFGDYDVDGVTSVALLTLFLRDVGVPVIPIIPHRERDGYGLNLELLQQVCPNGKGRLAITVDCGSSDGVEMAGAGELGIEVIVTDHHELPPDLPPALAVVNPKRPENLYPFNDLAGVGVAFLLVWGIASRLKEQGYWRRGKQPSLKKYLDLVALGTVADQAPLLGENRALVVHGLRQMALHPRPGLKALLRVCGSHNRTLSVGTVAFQLAPRINAPGRIGDAHPALDLLLTGDLQQAEELAVLLDEMNRKRQQLEEGIFREACALADREVGDGHRAIVLANETWHAGVVGIVASRLVDRYGLPTVLLAIHDGVAKGSARSPEDFHLMESLRSCDAFLQKYGGHRMAAGLRIDPRNLESFREAFLKKASLAMGDRSAGAILRIDDRLALEQVTQELVHHLSRLEPHGIGNPEPVFRMDRLEVTHSRRVGQGHLKLWVHRDGIGFDAIGFGLGSTHPDTMEGMVHIACVPQLNEWQGRTTIQLKLKDLRII